MIGMGQVVEVNWEPLALEDWVDARYAVAQCPFCEYACAIYVYSATQTGDHNTEGDVCKHFDGQTATGFFFIGLGDEVDGEEG